MGWVNFLHQAWRDTLEQAVDMYGKLLDRSRKRVDDRLDDILKAQRHAVDRIVQRYRWLGPCCSIPTSATTSRGPDCCPPCRRRSCTRTSPTWRTGRGAAAGPASSRPRSGTRMFSATKATPAFGERVEDGDDLTQRATEPGEFADDHRGRQALPPR